MNKENTKKLFERFDFFYPETPITESLMAFGLTCADGWFQLVWDLCENIEKELQKEKKEIDIKEKTKRLLRGEHRFKVTQVKEKFGTLRFYVNGATDKIYNMISEAENKSYTTCEVCGADAKPVKRGGWYATLCTDCAEKKDYKLIKEES